MMSGGNGLQRRNAAEHGNAGAGLGVEVNLAVRIQHAGEVLLAADVGDGGEQVAEGEV
ncbi:hypothetical protein ACIP17_38435 [Streptomyces iakyrus]|uniref:hypothetical protein n=1 Tax=Streptomyces iakyrus TaxID=68219 RepID=UPI0038164B1C